MFFVLFVCSANQCRSPLAEYLLRAALTRGGLREGMDFHVASAGVRDFADGLMPMAEGSLVQLQRRGIDGGAHRSRTLRAAETAAADLVLTMEAGHSVDAAVLCPGARDRIFTLKEFVGLAAADPDDPSVAGGVASVPQLAQRRGGMAVSPGAPDALDVADPMGGTPAMYETCAREMDGLVTRLATVLLGTDSRVHAIETAWRASVEETRPSRSLFRRRRVQ